MRKRHKDQYVLSSDELEAAMAHGRQLRSKAFKSFVVGSARAVARGFARLTASASARRPSTAH